jgi:hypothetical protein
MATGEAQGEGRGKPSLKLPPPTQAWPRSLHCVPRRRFLEITKTYAEQCDVIDSVVDPVGAEFHMPAVLRGEGGRGGGNGRFMLMIAPGREFVQINTPILKSFLIIEKNCRAVGSHSDPQIRGISLLTVARIWNMKARFPRYSAILGVSSTLHRRQLVLTTQLLALNLLKSVSHPRSASATAHSLFGGARDKSTADPRALVRLGMQQFAAGRVDDSVENFDAALALDPSLRPYLWQRGLSLYYVGTEQALQEASLQFR